MFARRERLKVLFREELALALRGVKDPGLSGLLTVTDLVLSPDMKTATVFYSIIGSGLQRQTSAEALERASPFLRQVLKKRLSLKMIPQLVFTYDDTPARAARVEKLLIQLEKEGGQE